ncbi:hypothetical protein TB1_016279 [Malus domestica]
MVYFSRCNENKIVLLNALFSRADDMPYIQEVDTGLIAYMHSPPVFHFLFIVIQYPVILPVWEAIDSI